MPPHDVGLKNLTGTRVDSRWSHGIGLGAGGIHERGAVEVVVVGAEAVGQHLGHDGILEAYALKCHVPVGDALQKVFAPLARRAVVDIELNGLHRLHELPFEVGCGVARHEAPALHIVAVVHALLVVGKAEHIGGEVAYARRVEAHLHGLLGQQSDGGSHLHGYENRLSALGNLRGQLRLGHNVVVVGLYAHDARESRLGRSVDVDVLEHVVHARLLAVVEVGDLNEHSGGVAVERLHLERLYHGRDEVVGYGASDVVAHRRVWQRTLLAQHHSLFVGTEGEAHHLRLVVDTTVHACLIQLLGHAREAVHHEHILAHAAHGYLIVILALGAVHAKEPGNPSGVAACDFLVVAVGLGHLHLSLFLLVPECGIRHLRRNHCSGKHSYQ